MVLLTGQTILWPCYVCRDACPLLRNQHDCHSTLVAAQADDNEDAVPYVCADRLPKTGVLGQEQVIRAAGCRNLIPRRALPDDAGCYSLQAPIPLTVVVAANQHHQHRNCEWPLDPTQHDQQDAADELHHSSWLLSEAGGEWKDELAKMQPLKTGQQESESE